MCKLNVVNVEKKDRPGCYARAARILTVEDINELKRFVHVEESETTGEYYIITENSDNQKLNLGDWVYGQTLDTVLTDKMFNNVAVVSDERMHEIANILAETTGDLQAPCEDERSLKAAETCNKIEVAKSAERFVKKPVEVQAMQFVDTPQNTADLSEFIGKDIAVDYANPQAPVLKIETLEGTMSASVGDYIIKGVKGEFYPCKSDIFEATYKKVEQVIYTIVQNPLLTQKYTFIALAAGKNSNTPTFFSIANVVTGEPLTKIVFQDGPIKEFGVNGVQNEDLIGCVIERLQAFQKGEFACRENAIAITKLEEGLLWLRARTNGREQRGVEGTSTK